MTNPFKDQREFMLASGQSVKGKNAEQFILYNNLVSEETQELLEAMFEVQEAGAALQACEDAIPTHLLESLVEAYAHAAKEAMDVIVTLTGYLLSMGVTPERAWDEVHRSNMGKIDPETGVILLRKDGKVQKPLDWAPPNMVQVVMDSWVENRDE